MEATRRSMGALVAGTATAFTLAGTQPGFAQTTDQTAISKQVETFREAFLKQDLAKLETLVTDTVNYGHSSGVI